MKELSDEELGKRLCELVGFPHARVTNRPSLYRRPGGLIDSLEICTKLDVVAIVEKIVIEKAGRAEYTEKLCEVQTDGEFSIKPGLTWLIDQHADGHYSAIFYRMGFVVEASARTRAQACLTALEGKDDR